MIPNHPPRSEEKRSAVTEALEILMDMVLESDEPESRKISFRIARKTRSVCEKLQNAMQSFALHAPNEDIEALLPTRQAALDFLQDIDARLDAFLEAHPHAQQRRMKSMTQRSL